MPHSAEDVAEWVQSQQEQQQPLAPLPEKFVDWNPSQDEQQPSNVELENTDVKRFSYQSPGVETLYPYRYA